MSKFFETETLSSFPKIQELRELLKQHEFLIIYIEDDLIDQNDVYNLNIELECYSVFYNKPFKKISFEPSISTKEIKDNITEFTTAVEMFDALAHELMSELMDFYEINSEEIHDFKTNKCEKQRGSFNGWDFHFHGNGCSFTNKITDQFLDVQMYNYREFGIIDFYYFLQFIKTTYSLNHLNLLLKDKVANIFKVCSILRSDNILTELPYMFHPRLFLKNKKTNV